MNRPGRAGWMLLLLFALATAEGASPLPIESFTRGWQLPEPVDNTAFIPPAGAAPGAAFEGTLQIGATALSLRPQLDTPVIESRDARIFPGVRLTLYTLGDVLVPLERGTMVAESQAGSRPSYWHVIPQYGRVWRERGDGGWSRAALPLMLVNDTENHAHQGLAMFLYKGRAVTGMRLQFVQQTAPYLTRRAFVSWGFAPLRRLPAPAQGAITARQRAEASAELAARLPARPWSELVAQLPPGTLDGFGGPLAPRWRVAVALVRGGTLYYQPSPTPWGPYPYPLEMRFGVRSIMKSVAAPLAMLRLAQVYGPWVLTLRIGDYVPGLDPKWQRIRFIDVANMASGFGGTGSLRTHPNDIFDGYLGGDYDTWYLAASHEEKLQQIRAHLRPYPWEPGTVVRYRDQDFYLLGAALDAFLKAMRGPDADLWEMVQAEVLRPIGIPHAPAVRTRESGGRAGLVWCNAGYYPTLEDLARVALLYQSLGEHEGRQILNRQLTEDLLAARGALVKSGDASLADSQPPAPAEEQALYHMGFHYIRYVAADGTRWFLPTMQGSGENQVILYPNAMISIITAKAAGEDVAGQVVQGKEGPATIRAVERIAGFGRR